MIVDGFSKVIKAATDEYSRIAAERQRQREAEQAAQDAQERAARKVRKDAAAPESADKAKAKLTETRKRAAKAAKDAVDAKVAAVETAAPASRCSASPLWPPKFIRAVAPSPNNSRGRLFTACPPTTTILIEATTWLLSCSSSMNCASHQCRMMTARNLIDTDGDTEAAVRSARKGPFRSTRDKSQGSIINALFSDDGKVFAMRSQTETDFVAKTDNFKASALLPGQRLRPQDLSENWYGAEGSVMTIVSQTGETLRSAVRLTMPGHNALIESFIIWGQIRRAR
jgi:hypothetical protein